MAMSRGLGALGRDKMLCLTSSQPKRLGSVFRILLTGLLTLALACINTPVYAWDFAGHFIVAAIAEQQLDPPVKAEVQRLLHLLADAEPAVSELIPASAWLDAQNWNPDFGLMNDWHFTGLPYPPSSLPPSGRLIEVSAMALKTLHGPRSSDFQKALMLRVLLHTIADMHQPLHVISYLSAAHPTGDQGGRLFALGGPYPNLHALWDAAGGQYPYLKLDNWQQALPLAKRLQAEYPPDRFGARPPNPHAFIADFLENPGRWADESYLIALTAGYNDIQAGREPDARYLERMRIACRRQLALAGYRLAHLLNAGLVMPSVKTP